MKQRLLVTDDGRRGPWRKLLHRMDAMLRQGEEVVGKPWQQRKCGRMSKCRPVLAIEKELMQPYKWLVLASATRVGDQQRVKRDWVTIHVIHPR